MAMQMLDPDPTRLDLGAGLSSPGERNKRKEGDVKQEGRIGNNRVSW
jgi:hypothetical protein